MLVSLVWVLLGLVGINIVFGIYSHKMIGTERISAVTIMYFLYGFQEKKTETLSIF